MTNEQLYDKFEKVLKSEIAASEKRVTTHLSKRMDDGFNGIAEAIMKINDLHDNQEHRLVALELWRQKRCRAT